MVPDASPAAGCRSCELLATPQPPPRLLVARTDHWAIAHAVDACIEGWLVVLPLHHVVALDELDIVALGELGPLLGATTAALRRLTGCAKTYVALFAEAEGFPHVHFHVVPRSPDLDARFVGPRVFGLLGASDGHDEVPAVRQDALALQLRSELVTRGAARAPSVEP